MYDMSVLASSTMHTMHALCKQTDHKTEIRVGEFEVSVTEKRQLPETYGVKWFSHGKSSRRRHSRCKSNHVYGRGWKILAYMLAVKEDQESCLKHSSRRDFGTWRWHWQRSFHSYTLFRAHYRWLHTQQFAHCVTTTLLMPSGPPNRHWHMVSYQGAARWLLDKEGDVKGKEIFCCSFSLKKKGELVMGHVSHCTGTEGCVRCGWKRRWLHPLLLSCWSWCKVLKQTVELSLFKASMKESRLRNH